MFLALFVITQLLTGWTIQSGKKNANTEKS